MEEDVKKQLDRLQGLVLSETGERISQSELLARLLRQAEKDPTAVLQKRAAWAPPSPEQVERWLASLPDEGPETDASRVDETLYGE
ncbi:MAG TPA: hypothetical protein VM681_00690 [Candidatus Thermoplasmatota archaeon]|nr:hypothetical protein [Candidatus Thermoplasmatota archaeon]